MKKDDFTYYHISTIENILEETIGSSIKSFYLEIKGLDIDTVTPTVERITEEANNKKNAYNLTKNNEELKKESKKIIANFMSRHQELVPEKKLLDLIVNNQIGPLLYKIDDNYISATRENFILALKEMKSQTIKSLEDALLLSTTKKIEIDNNSHLDLVTKYDLHPDFDGKVANKELVSTSKQILKTSKLFISTLCDSTIPENYMVPTSLRENTTLDKLETYNHKYELYKNKDN